MELADYIKLYEHKAKEKFEPHPGFRLIFLPERGFCEIKIDKDLLIIRQTCGDGDFWLDFAHSMAQLFMCQAIALFLVRNVKAYIRRWGYQINKVESLPDGTERYHCTNSDGKWGLASPCGAKNDGSLIYMITREV